MDKKTLAAEVKTMPADATKIRVQRGWTHELGTFSYLSFNTEKPTVPGYDRASLLDKKRWIKRFVDKVEK